MQKLLRVLLCTGLTLAGCLISSSQPTLPAAAQSTLPPVPVGWPSTVQLGMGDGPGGAATMRATAAFGFRYQYLTGGVNTGSGWSTWNPNGAFVTYYIQDSIANHITPVLTYYQLRQSAPNSSSNDGDADYANLQDVGTMTAYYNDLKLFFQRASAFRGNMVVLHVEPDLWGFLEQRATNGDASTVPAQVSSTGLSELSGMPNTVSGFAQAIAQLRTLYAPNVILAYHLSVWGTGNDILYTKPDNTTVTNVATQAANWYLSLRANFDIAFAEYSDRDAAFKQYVYGDGGAAWWSASDFSRNELFITQFVSRSQKRLVFWQIPVGNTRMLAENNTWDHYQDNHVEWLLDDATRNNLNAYVQAGALAFLFGAGANGATCFCDAANDGITNPPAINGNTGRSFNADDDGGFFRNRAAAYYAAGAMPLPATGTPPTPTPVQTATSSPTTAATLTPTATRTLASATATPRPTSSPVAGSRTLSFDDLSNPDRVLNGQYPSGVIDWGTNAWWLSGPYGRFATQSISFNGGGPTRQSFNLLSPGWLVQLDAYNGGTASSTISLSCAGQHTVTATLAVNQVTTIATHWSGMCSSTTIGSSNGWDTNFDNLVVSTSSAVTSTPTPTSTPTSTSTPQLTRTPTPTLTSTTQTLTFDDLTNPGRPLNGQYPTNVAVWGTNVWYLSAPWGQFTTNSISFGRASATSASFTLVGGRRLVRVDAYNGGSTPSTVVLACTGLPTVTATVAPNHIASISTNWTASCNTVTVSSSNGWFTNFDNIVLQ